MRQAFDLFTLPGTMIAMTASIVCILFGYLIMAAATPRPPAQGDESNVKKVASAVDISSSLRQEESLSTANAPVDSRVLNPIEFRKFKVLEVIKLSHNTKRIRFEIPHARSLGLTIGKHISIQAHIDGQRVIRAYTPSSPIYTQGYFELVVKKYEFGKMSNFIHSLKVGQEVDVRGPVGRYKYQPNQHKRIGMIAGGTGLTPCLQVIRTVLEGDDAADKTCFTLFFQNRCEKDILLHDELDTLAERYPSRVAVLYFLSNTQSKSWGKDENSNEIKGYISASHIADHMSPADCTQVCVCGPSGFNEYVNGLLMEAGHTKDTVFIW